jgi:sulfatase modifying factor 1
MDIKIGLLLLLAICFSCSENKKAKNKTTSKEIIEKSTTTKSAPADTSGMAYFKGGKFMIGSEKGLPGEHPVHEVTIKPFLIDKSPVTVAQFRKFIESTQYKTEAERFGDSGVFDFKIMQWQLLQGAYWEKPLGKDGSKAENNHPVTHVSWNDAVAYAGWSGKRLPTENEWEFAARCGNISSTKFSWGDKVVENGVYKTNVWQGDDLKAEQGKDGFVYTSPVGFFGKTSCGMTDMGGNVWNWCSDTYKPYPGSTTPYRVDPKVKVIRGGSFFFDQYGEDSYSTTGRSFNSHETSLFNTGFRCAIDAK